MFMTAAVTTLGPVMGHYGGPYGPGFGAGWWIVFPILWFALIATLIALVVRRGRRGGWGPGYPVGPGGWAAAGHRGASARSVLAERYARGEIDEQEYRARLEVLLSTEERPG